LHFPHLKKREKIRQQISLSKTHIHSSHIIAPLSAKEEEREHTHVIKMASKNKKFNVKHMGGNVDRNESEQVTKDYEVRSFAFHRFIASFWNGLVKEILL
jgi:hypothetical protein|tara:strand:- start:70 stop:369 length:300 start_codon:yes stop_codon:yes gene_type:complete